MVFCSNPACLSSDAMGASEIDLDYADEEVLKQVRAVIQSQNPKFVSCCLTPHLAVEKYSEGNEDAIGERDLEVYNRPTKLSRGIVFKLGAQSLPSVKFASSRSVSPTISTSSGSSRGTSPASTSTCKSSWTTFPLQALRSKSDTENPIPPHALRQLCHPFVTSDQPTPCFEGVHCLRPQGLDNDFARAIAPGDVVYVPGSGSALAEIGTIGGFMGHFMVVLERPHKIVAGTIESNALYEIWPAGIKEIWKVSVLECTRGTEGLHETQLLIRVDRCTGKFILFGEIDDMDGQLCKMEDEPFEVWQSPPQLRAGLRPDFIEDVALEMKLYNGSWSMKTAARAFFRSASTFSSIDKSELLSEIQDCWDADPICTSVVIIFWQRYLSKLAKSLNASGNASAHETDLILNFMPLKADRGLPGDVLRALKECGWTMTSRLHRSSCDNNQYISPRAHLRLPEANDTQMVDTIGSAESKLASELQFRTNTRMQRTNVAQRQRSFVI